MLDFRILGPMQVLDDDREIAVGGPRPRLVLAVLLLEAGRVVSTDRLVEAVWRDDPPVSVRAQIAIHISALRKALAQDDVIETVSGGYRLNAEAVRIDARCAERLIGEGRLQRDPGPLRDALALWRGPVLAGITAPGTQELEELRLAAAEEWAELELEAGHPETAVGDLRTLVAENPFRERLREQLMTALHRLDRHADAIAVYEQGRDLIIEELGLEPGAELRRLHELIANGEPAVRQAAPVPAELPGGLATFTGRAAEVARLREMILDDGTPAVAISGPGGIGKSALAIHVGHRIADAFPDGQLYANLHGATPDARHLAPGEVLARFLRGLGVATSDIPTDEEEAAARFRSVTHGKRLLIVLDNVADAAQLRPLLPGTTTCRVLITSRRVLSSVDGVRHEPLDVLTTAEAADLLTRLAGEERIGAEPDAVADVVRLCGRLPLALAIAGARLIARPGWTIRALADRLAVEQRRLAELTADDQAVRGSFAVSYEDLDDPGAARMFRLFSLMDGEDLSLPVAAALAGLPESRTAALLDQLVDFQLLDAHRARRFRMHDLLRVFARERSLAEDSAADRAAAVRRGLACYVATVRNAALAVDPGSAWRLDLDPIELDHPGVPLGSVREVDAWINAERANIVAAARQAVVAGDPGSAVRLTACLDTPVENREGWRHDIELSDIALDAAASTGNPAHYGIGHNDRGWAMITLGRFEDAVTHFDQAIEAWRSIGHEIGEAVGLQGGGAALRKLGRYDASLEYLERALPLWRNAGYARREGATLTGMGLTYRRQGRLEEAIAAHREALALARRSDVLRTEIMALGNLGEAYRVLGRKEEAVEAFEEALRRGHEGGFGGTYWEAEHLWGLGRARDDHSCLNRAAELLHQLGLITHDQLRKIAETPDPPTPQVIAHQL